MRLILGQYVKPFRRLQENIAEDHNDLLSLYRVRSSFVRQRTAVMHQLESFL